LDAGGDTFCQVAVAPTHHDDAQRLAALLYERHARALEGFCLRLLRDRDDAQEAVQSTFLRAYGALQRGVRPHAESAWLLTIARNVCASLSTSAARRREVDTDPTLLDAIAPPAGEPAEPDPELAEALAALPDGQRRAILLRAVHGLTYREIAGELGVGLCVVETWIFRARRSLAAGVGHTRRLALELPSLVAAGRALVAAVPGAKASAVVVATATTGVAAKDVLAPAERGEVAAPVRAQPAPAVAAGPWASPPMLRPATGAAIEPAAAVAPVVEEVVALADAPVSATLPALPAAPDVTGAIEASVVPVVPPLP
jgi:RNA polymerase sigma factor (sigma-70 family)